MTRPLAALAALAALLPCCPPALAGQDVDRGRALYDRWCAGCHGDGGAGDGEAARYMLPPPRDFTRGVYQVRTTASGELPSDADLRRVIDEGMPGTAMPGWRSRLNAADRDAVIAYLKTFSAFFEGAAPQPLDIGRAPGGGEDAIAEGRQVFAQLECFKCHGDAGRGDGTSAPTLTDDWDAPIRAANLTQGWRFNGGGSVADIYARLRTGLDGTPMPSFADVVDAGIITDAQLWRVAQYVRSLSPDEGEPPVREVIRAVRLEGDLPAGPADTAWEAVPRSWVPLVAQIVVAPRWFAPMVHGVWVQAVHDGARLALRISWDDPSRSPDPAWQPWLTGVAAAMTDADGANLTTQGPDRLHVQFPRSAAPDADVPFFLGGSARTPVVLWAWSSEGDRLVEGTATGLGTLQPFAGNAAVVHAAAFAAGQWSLQLVRSLVPEDSVRGPAFHPGATVPVAFYAADGSNGEDSRRGSVSAWYMIYLDVPTPARVYVAPVLAALVTAGLGVVVIRRAQRTGRPT